MTMCQVDGYERTALDQGPGFVVWRCNYCQEVSREEVTNDDGGNQ